MTGSEARLDFSPVGSCGSGVDWCRGGSCCGCGGGSGLRPLATVSCGCRSCRLELGLGVAPVGVLLHVFGQVGLLRVRLAAELADVGLQVLRLLVLRDVVQQGVLVDEALVARVALVRLVCLVASAVKQKQSIQGKVFQFSTARK